MPRPIEIDRSCDTGEVLNAALVYPTRALFGRRTNKEDSHCDCGNHDNCHEHPRT